MQDSPQETNQDRRFGHGCVVSYCPLGSSIGAKVLRLGGNAIDAAVATGLALTVTYPQAGNIGGGGFMLVRLANGESHFLDYREQAPAKINELRFVDDSGRRNDNAFFGGASVCTPGTVSGFAAAIERFGTWSWDRIVGLVVDLVEAGHWVTTRQSAYFQMYREDLSRYETTRKAYGEAGLVPGTLWPQPELAWTFRKLAEEGPEAFYKGEIAQRIVDTCAATGGIISREDLASYAPRWREPIIGKFHNRELITAPLPSGGGLVIRVATAVLEAHDFSSIGPRTPARYRLLARAFRVAFELRRQLAGDPDFMTEQERADSVEVLKKSLNLAHNIDELERFLGLVETRRPEALERAENTTHYSVLDRDGNAVSNTYSLNTLFGSKLVPDGCGFLLNNSIDDFSLAPKMPNYYGVVEDGKNEPVPGRRPTGSMAPTITVSPDGNSELLIGASGGPRIPTAITQLLASVLGYNETLPEAMLCPRVHHQLVPDKIFMEPGVRYRVQDALANYRGGVEVRQRLGIGAGIHRTEDGQVFGALDFRFSQQI